MIVALLLACEATDDSQGAPAAPDTAADPDPGARPALPFAPDAEDLDPAAGSLRVAMAARAATYTVGAETIHGYGYDGVAPGPVLRAQVGDVITLELHNALEVETTLHWHGMEVPNAMDGVTLVQTPIPAGGAFTYTVPAARPGTFWYHPHVDTDRQVDLGLYGAVVVTEPAEPVADRDVVLVFDAWDEVESGAGATDDHTPPDPRLITWTVNGAVEPIWELAPGERVRARLINASNTSYLALDWPGARVLGTDQGLGDGAGDAAWVLAPGDRLEVEVLAGGGAVDVTTRPWAAAGGAAFGDSRRLFTVEGGDVAAEPLAYPLPTDPPSPDPGRTDLIYVFQGGAPDTDWLINGEAWPDVTVATLPLGEEAIVELRNLSATNHPFHLHGNRAEVLSVDGVAPPTRRFEDTIDVAIRSRVRLRVVPDNPGDWLVHCHLLGHEQGGMIAMMRVE